jgi:acyl dehydratase
MPPTRPKSPLGRARSRLRPNDRQRSETRPQGTPEAVSDKPPAFSRAAWDAALEAIRAHAARAAGYARAHWNPTTGEEAAAAHIARHGAHVILSGIGVPALKWADAEAPWIAAFVDRYNLNAGALVIPITAPSHPPWRTDEPPRGVRCLVTALPGAGEPRVFVASRSLDSSRPQWFSDGLVITGVTAWMLAPEPARRH